MSETTYTGLVLGCVATVVMLVVWILVTANRDYRYTPVPGRESDYQQFVRLCTAYRADVTGHTRTCNDAAVELGLARMVESH